MGIIFRPRQHVKPEYHRACKYCGRLIILRIVGPGKKYLSFNPENDTVHFCIEYTTKKKARGEATA